LVGGCRKGPIQANPKTYGKAGKKETVGGWVYVKRRSRGMGGNRFRDKYSEWRERKSTAVLAKDGDHLLDLPPHRG